MGTLEFIGERIKQDTIQGYIVKFMQDAQTLKARIQRLAEKMLE